LIIQNCKNLPSPSFQKRGEKLFYDLLIDERGDEYAEYAEDVELEDQPDGEFQQAEVYGGGVQAGVDAGIDERVYSAGREPEIAQFADEQAEKRAHYHHDHDI